MEYTPKPLYLMKPAEYTPEIRGAMTQFFTEWFKHHAKSESDLLYHYTTREGMLGILRSKNLRFGHSTSFNDPNEILYGQKVIVSVIQDRLTNEENQDVRRFLSILTGFVNLTDSIGYDFYIACFCETDNLLSQWRAYSSQGGGFCLGFDLGEKTKMVPDESDLISEVYLCLRKVLYDENTQKDLVGKYIDSLIAAVKAVDLSEGDSDPQVKISLMAIEAANVLWDFVISFKNAVFKEETEWRIVYASQRTHEASKVNFVQSDPYLKPYRTFYFYQNVDNSDVFPLKSITSGPSLDTMQIDASLNILANNLQTETGNILFPKTVDVRTAGYKIK
jgi:hypothetical protein